MFLKKIFEAVEQEPKLSRKFKSALAVSFDHEINNALFNVLSEIPAEFSTDTFEICGKLVQGEKKDIDVNVETFLEGMRGSLSVGEIRYVLLTTPKFLGNIFGFAIFGYVFFVKPLFGYIDCHGVLL